MLLDVFKDGDLVETIELSASKRLYKVGRQAGVADIVLGHGSISRDHATLTVSSSGSVVVADLGSAHGTKLSGKKIEANKPHLLPPGRSLTFGASTRVFKLREGGSGFVGGAGVPVSHETSSADDPRVQAVLQVLRNGSKECERPRPDGFMRLSDVLGAHVLQRIGCSETELASLPSRVPSVIESVSAEGELLLRSVDGHAAELRVQTDLRLTACPTVPQHLVFATSFKEWNAVRSHGAGAGQTPPAPIRLCLAPPPPGLKLRTLGRVPDLHVYLRTASMLADGVRLYGVADGAATAAEDGPAAADGAARVTEEVESVVCVGDGDGGAIGPWHFDRVLNARDGSEMMSADEVEPLRQMHARKAAEQRAVQAAAAQAAEARRVQREEARRRREEADEDHHPPAKRFNPYLAHMGE